MNLVEKAQELIEAPLSREQLAVRYRELCDDPCLANVPGKIELDIWGRILMTPASTHRALLRGRLCQRLAPLGREAFGAVAIATATGLFVTDVAWASSEFVKRHRGETPLMQAPEICIEVASPSNSVKELREKITAHLAAGAEEVWIAYLQSKRCEFHSTHGRVERSRYAVNLDGLFE